MDGHYLLVVDTYGGAAPCPVDGSSANVAQDVLSLCGAITTTDATLHDLVHSGLPRAVASDLLIVEFPPDTSKVPTTLHPWFDGERAPR